MKNKSTLPLGLQVRPADWSDLQAVLALMNAVDEAAYGAPDSDLEDLRDSWQDINLAKDTWVVETSDTDLVGYAAVFPDSEELTLDFLTRPGLEIPGLAEYLLSCCHRRAHGLRAEHDGYPVRANTIIPHVSDTDRDILHNLGYQPRKYYFQMQIEVEAEPEPPDWPDGAVLRVFRKNTDEVDVYSFIQEAFNRPGYQRPPFDRWRDFMIGSGRFDPNLWYLLIHDGSIIGAALCYDYDDLGWIRQLGVAPAWRRRGLGTSLLQHSFREFYKRNRARIALGVSAENPNAIGLYERVGMKVFRQYDEYFKILAA